MRAPLRHGAVLATGGLLLWAFVAIRPDDLHPVHTWNRAWADVAVVLVAAIFVIGPLARLWPKAAPALAWRRELGVWGFAAALIHVGYYASEAFDWDLTRFVQDAGQAGRHGVSADGWRTDAWGASNWVGVIALAYGVLPLLTSNNVSQRLLGGAWKRLQDQGHVFYILTMVHFFLFWLIVYVPEQRGPATALFIGTVVLVGLSQSAGLWAKVARR